MTALPLRDRENLRVAALRELEILDTEPERDFNNIVVLAAQLCQLSFSAIAFFDQDRIWYKASTEPGLAELPGIHDLIWTADDIIVESTDTNPLSGVQYLLKSMPALHSILSMPLVTEEGYIIGSLSVGDTKTRIFTEQERSALLMLGQQVMSLLKVRKQRTELIRAERIRGNIFEVLRSIFTNAVDAVIISDEEGLISQWNPRAELMFGWKAEEAIGKYFHEMVVPERNYDAFRQKKQAFRPDGLIPSDNHKHEFIAIRKDGTEFDVAMGVSPAKINGQLYFIGIISDITDRKQIATELDKQKEFYENILNKIPTDIAVFAPDHKYLFVNPWGIKDEVLRKYIIGKDDFEYARYRNRPDDIAVKRREQFLEAKRTGKEIRWEDSLRGPDGQVITHLRRLFPVYDEDQQLSFIIGFGIDITDRKIMEEKQDALVKQLSAQNAQLLDFCNIVSHNLRGPLINVSMLVDFIEESQDVQEQKELVSKLNPVIESLNATFNELVESIQIKQDLEIKSEPVNLNDCVQRTLGGLEIEIKKVRAVISIDFSQAAEIRFPPKYLLSIFHNLISNSLKYHAPERDLVVNIKTKKSGSSIILTVQDNGLGIDLVKHQENVFKIGKVFHRHPNAKGLGLYMTKAQVEAMGGKIHIESAPDQGATFSIEFINQIHTDEENIPGR
ncbi:PAS domain S-box protein [Pedobacter nutrimenti]|jgi:PAS domain S-box-containing protein|uniref:histidine kinase n=1 Tax=Pedobacter nutrimenti TaxID=1241337 RepID=A0A318UB62_9SPHI|nr:PAS domain S-box protein [Pedobacter nutrimenti]PYF70139.1 PAS domain S-box-containing protein [Pedobacter nutrimenti]